MSSEQNSRFKGAPWFTDTFPIVTIGGAGGIGSWLSFFFSRIGFNVDLYDFDVIEPHNLGGQLFRKEDIGKPKVFAVAEIVRSFTGKNLTVKPIAIDEGTQFRANRMAYCFSAFDNMEARKTLFAKWVEVVGLMTDEEKRKAIFMDGRLEAEQLQIFCVTVDRIEEYRKYLFDDTEVDSAPCTMKQTSHSASIIASLMTAFLTNHYTNVVANEQMRDVPFFHEYFIPLNITEYEPTE